MKSFKKGIAIKIQIYQIKYQSQVEETVYYRYNVPLWIVEKWKWYYEYLTALLKVNNPKRKVALIITGQSEMLCGDDYVQEKTKSLLKYKKAYIKKLASIESDDLFGFGKEGRNKKIERLEYEIERLENGCFDYYIPPTYINKIKKWINK